MTLIIKFIIDNIIVNLFGIYIYIYKKISKMDDFFCHY